MRYKYYSRTAKRKAKKGKRSLLLTIILIIVLIYASIQWIIPSLISGLGLISSSLKPEKKIVQTNFESMAPPILNIPFEATSAAQINIGGFSTPDSTVELYLDDTLTDSTKTSSDGSFFFSDIPLGFGRNNIFGKTVDEKGIKSLPSKTLIVYLDNEKPSLSLTEPEDSKVIQGGDKKINIKGKTEKDAKIYINELRVIVAPDGSFAGEQPLNEGDNVFTIKSIDKAGNETDVVRKITYKN